MRFYYKMDNVFEGIVKVRNKKDGRQVLPIQLILFSGECNVHIEYLYHDAEECWALVPFETDQNNQKYRSFRIRILDKHNGPPFMLQWSYCKHWAGEICGRPTITKVYFDLRASDMEIQLSETVTLSLQLITYLNDNIYDTATSLASLNNLHYRTLQRLCTCPFAPHSQIHSNTNLNIHGRDWYIIHSTGIGCKQMMIDRIELYHHSGTCRSETEIDRHSSIKFPRIELAAGFDYNHYIAELDRLPRQELHKKCSNLSADDLKKLTRQEWRDYWHGGVSSRRSIMQSIARVLEPYISPLRVAGLILWYNKIADILYTIQHLNYQTLYDMCSNGKVSNYYQWLELTREEWISCWRTGEGCRNTMAMHIARLVDAKPCFKT